MNTETEYELRPIAGYEGKYSVSNTGEVFSHNYLHTGKTAALKQKKHRDDYLIVTLCHNGERKMKLVHRLVLEAFVPNPHNREFCDHIDGNRTNNHVSNLRWVTSTENNNNPITRKRVSESKKDKNIYKFRNKDTGEEFIGERYNFIKKYDLDQSNVSTLIKGKRKLHKGWVLVQVMS